MADDHRIVREGIRTLLERHPDLKVVGEVSNGIEAIEFARDLSPDVVVLDITMPEMNGSEATRQLIDENPNLKIIALSVHSDKDMVTEMLRAGASGYLTKECAFEELVQAIQQVVAGQKYLSMDIKERVAEDFISDYSRHDGNQRSLLAPKERLILQLIAEGNSTKEIAGQLELSIKTVETHRLRMMNKLGITNIAGLVKYAIREGLTTLDDRKMP